MDSVSDGRESGNEGAGVVGYQGSVHLAGDVQWTIRVTPARVLDLPATTIAGVLAALGHPVRLAIVRRLLTGPASAGELGDVASRPSDEELHDHLRHLTAARLVEEDDHRYRVPATGVVPLLVSMLAAADLGGSLR
jgi:ArsR family transcriptional regulator, arsenate/arsenite/antimonite-responsive transcriptional repressor